MNNLGINKLLIDNGAHRHFYDIIDLPLCWIKGKPINVSGLVFNDIKNFIKKYVNISKGTVYVFDIKHEKGSYYIKFYYDEYHTNKIKQRILKLKKLNLL